MGIDKIKKKKKRPGQLVAKSKNGKRPGYYGSDDYGSGEDGQGGGGGGGGGGSDNGGSDDNYMDYYSAPAPSPEPSYSVQDDLTDYATNVGSTASVGGGFEDDSSGDDQEDDVAQMMVDMGLTPNNAPTDFTLPDAEDDGNNLYVTPSQTIEINPVDEFGTKGNVYADTGFTPISSPNVTYDTIANLPAPEPKGILQTIGSGLKTAAKFALPILAPAFLPASLAKGYTTYNQAKTVANLANKFGVTNRTLPTLTELAKNIPQGTGPKGPPTGFDDNDSGSDNIIPKNVIAKNVQRYSPAQINTLQKNRDLLQTYAEAGRLNEKGTQTLQQMNNIIEEYLV